MKENDEVMKNFAILLLPRDAKFLICDYAFDTLYPKLD